MDGYVAFSISLQIPPPRSEDKYSWDLPKIVAGRIEELGKNGEGIEKKEKRMLFLINLSHLWDIKGTNEIWAEATAQSY